MRKIVLTYGLIAGAVMAALMLMTMPFMDRIGFDRGAVIGYTGMVLAFLMVYFGIRTYRDQAAGGRISFGRACAVGMGIVLVATTCYVLTWQVLFYGFMPDFMDQYTAHALQQMRASGASEAMVAAKARDMAEFAAMYRNPLVNIGFTLLEPLPVGLLFTLVSAGLLSRRR